MAVVGTGTGTSNATNVLHNYQDTIIGRSTMVLYLGASTVTTPTIDYHAAASQFYSLPVQFEYNANVVGAQTIGDLNFDIKVDSPFTLSGEGFITISSGVKNVRDYGAGNGWWFVVKVRHVSAAAAETTLSTSTGIMHQETTKGKRENLPISISTAKRFVVGETLRITIEVHAEDADLSGANNELAMGHDPQNRNGGDVAPSTNTLKDSVGTLCKAELPINIFKDN